MSLTNPSESQNIFLYLDLHTLEPVEQCAGLIARCSEGNILPYILTVKENFGLGPIPLQALRYIAMFV
ncbi:hypothetical protein Pfo_009139 [Paulownia fortunei]|nr:hypothetical protein Pfo_009139 [Paulownia fortunei]